jgi:biotin synthase
MSGRQGISFEEAAALLSDFSHEALVKLLPRTSALRRDRSGDAISLCSIVNARCGNCGENCGFCAQSSRSKANIKTWPLLKADEIFKAAETASANGASHFGIVTSGRALNRENELDTLCEAIARIASALPIKPCASLGILKEAELSRLRDAGLKRYHHNLETSRSFFQEVCTTRDYSAQTETVVAAKKAGLSVCSGGLFGLGESPGQRAELLETIREMDVDSVPINFLNPIPGTPLADAKRLTPLECLNIIAVARLMMPETGIRVCGGREVNLRDFQSWIFAAGADSLMVGGYLVTPGRTVESDIRMILDSGLQIQPPAGAI